MTARLCGRLLAGIITASTLAAADLVNGKSFADFAAGFDRVRTVAELNEGKNSDGKSPGKAEITAAADRIVAGKIPFYDKEWIDIGVGEVDWTGGQRNHQEWVAQLNRFRYLATLADAWEATGDAKYPARALSLMEDFRKFVVDKHHREFFDPQNNNELNVSIRMLNWSLAIRRMGMSPVFTDRKLADLIEFMDWELDGLDRVTKPGMSNFQLAQADALVLTALYWPDLPGSGRRLKHGAAVLGECLAKQFRPDGTHWENAAGYHGGMLRIAIKYRKLGQVFPAIPPVMPDAVFAGAIDFLYLARPWGFNNYSLGKHFPAFRYDLELARSLAEEAGIPDWQPPLRHAFPDAGIFFAGNRDEHLMFDAAKVGSTHSHSSRLMILYAAYGEIIIADSGVTTYEKSTPFYVGGRHTANHATVNPDNLAQHLVDARAEYWKIEPDFAVLAGCFDAGYVKWEQGYYNIDRKPEFAGSHRRTVIWLADASLLIFDRVAGKAERWNYVFPVPDQDRLESDPAGASFFSVNAKRPNFRVRLLNPPGSGIVQKILRGEAGVIPRGWRGTLTGGAPMPLLEFSVAGVTPEATAVTRIAAFKPGEAATDVEILERAADRVVFRHPDGRTDCWAWNASSFKLNGMAIEFKGEHLLLRLDGAGKLATVFADRGETLSVNGKVLLDHPGKPFTGYL